MKPGREKTAGSGPRAAGPDAANRVAANAKGVYEPPLPTRARQEAHKKNGLSQPGQAANSYCSTQLR
jgi:hypothetical protein